MSQGGIAVEGFAVLRFRRFLANARLQSDVVGSVHPGAFSLCQWLMPLRGV
jgi:hypothetical protein